MAMPNEHRQMLRRNRVDLVKDILLGPTFFAVLRRDNIITEDMNEEIDAERTRQSKVGVLLDMLPRRGKQAFPTFIEALVASNQNHLAEMLDSSLCAKLQGQPEQDPSAMDTGDGSRVTDDTDATIETKIKEIDAEGADMSVRVQCSTLKTNQDMYAMNHKPRGRAVIISNMHFTSLPIRLGTDQDVKNLTALFQQLHFIVVCHENKTAEEMRQLLVEESCHVDHRDADAFVLMVLSHGKQDSVYSLDGVKINIDDITSYFYADNCPALRGKPKLFIIQACQGDRDTSTVQGVEALSGRDRTDAYDEMDGVPPSEFRAAGAIARADILVAKATVNDFVARRNTQKGSWFIRCLVYVLSRKACKDHLADMLTEVIRISATRRDTYIQLPVKSSDTLTQKLYFMP